MRRRFAFCIAFHLLLRAQQMNRQRSWAALYPHLPQRAKRFQKLRPPAVGSCVSSYRPYA
eukprot:7380189-Prymnesium_polylepis.2